VDGQYCVGLKFPSQIIKSLRVQFQIHSLLQSGRVIQVSPPQVSPASLAQLAPGQGLVVLVRVLGRGGIEQHKGVALPSSPDSPSYLLRFWCKVGGEKRTIEKTIRFGDTGVQTVTLQPSSVNDQHRKNQAEDALDCARGQMLAEAVDPVLPKALTKALTAPPTMRSFFAAAPKVGPSAPKAGPSASKNDDVLVKGEKSRGEAVSVLARDESQPNSEKRQKIGFFGAPLAAEGGSPPCDDASVACKSTGSIATPQTQRKPTAFGGPLIAEGRSKMLTSPQAGKKSFGASRKPDVKTERISSVKPVDIFAAARLSVARLSAAESPESTPPVTQGSLAVEAQSKAEVMDLTGDD
jgi:hypothetical protein